jgi:uncharacterized protein (TIGR03435 family)
MRASLLLAACLLAPAWATAEVTDASPSGFTIKVTLSVQASPDEVYRKLVRNVGDWWDSSHTFSGNSHNLTIDERPAGCFCEKLPDGGGVRHMEVAYLAPGKRVVLQGALGPLQSLAATGAMTIQFSPLAEGTKLDVTYAVVGYLPAGLNTLAAPVDGVLTELLTRLKNYAEHGDPNTPHADAQLQSTPPQFEVASIKLNKSADMGYTWRIGAGGRFTGENIPLKFLFTTAYHLKESQISGIPGWADTERYDIVAKGEGNPTQDQMVAMLQGLLADRFKLRFHQVTREMLVYALVAAKNGAKLQESAEGSCVVPSPGEAPVASGQPPPAVCGTYFWRGGQVDGFRITMPQLIVALESQLDRPLIDKTGLNGAWDVHLEWTPDDRAGNGPGDDAGPSIYTALQEQLGLKLEATKGAVQVLVIDHFERPSEN